MPRNVRVVTMALGGRRQPTVEANRWMVMDLLDQACAERPDVVCLPETFTTVGMRGPAADAAEPVPGPTTDAAAERARRHRTYVVCPVLRAAEGRVFNSAVFLDRQGQVAGVYDKVHPVTTVHRRTARFDGGCTPGEGFPVLDLDFGRVGAQICFDLGFPEGWAALEDGGAELVFWPSAYDGGFHLRAMAYLHHYYLASAVTSGHAYVISPLGEVLERGGGFRPIAARTVDLDYRVCHFDWHRQRLEEMRARYGRDVAVRVLEEEGLFLVESRRADLPLAEVLREFPLESCRDYHRRHLEPHQAVRQGRMGPMDLPERRDAP